MKEPQIQICVMSSLLDLAFTWFGIFVEAFVTLICDVFNCIITSLSLTSDSTNSDTINQENKDNSEQNILTNDPKVSEKILTSYLPEFVQDLAVYFAFDDFQFLLLKIFLGILVGNIFAIYIAWKIYGERISEFFMSDTPSKYLALFGCFKNFKLNIFFFFFLFFRRSSRRTSKKNYRT